MKTADKPEITWNKPGTQRTQQEQGTGRGGAEDKQDESRMTTDKHVISVARTLTCSLPSCVCEYILILTGDSIMIGYERGILERLGCHRQGLGEVQLSVSMFV